MGHLKENLKGTLINFYTNRNRTSRNNEDLVYKVNQINSNSGASMITTNEPLTLTKRTSMINQLDLKSINNINNIYKIYMSDQPYNKTLKSITRFKSGLITPVVSNSNLIKTINSNTQTSLNSFMTSENTKKLNITTFRSSNMIKDSIDSSLVRRDTKVKFANLNLAPYQNKMQERRNGFSSIARSVSNEISLSKTQDRTKSKINNISAVTNLMKATSVSKININRHSSNIILGNAALHSKYPIRLTSRASGQQVASSNHESLFKKVNVYSTKNLNYLINMEISKKEKLSNCSTKSLVSKSSFHSFRNGQSKVESMKGLAKETLSYIENHTIQSYSKIDNNNNAKEESLRNYNKSELVERMPTSKQDMNDDDSSNDESKLQRLDTFQEKSIEDSDHPSILYRHQTNNQILNSPAHCIDKVIEISSEDNYVSSRPQSGLELELEESILIDAKSKSRIEHKVNINNIVFEANSIKDKLLTESRVYMKEEKIGPNSMSCFGYPGITQEHTNSNLIKDLNSARQTDLRCCDLHIKDELKGIQSFPYVNKLVDKLYFSSTRDRVHLTDFIESSSKPDTSDIWCETRSHLFANFSKHKEKEKVINGLSLRPTKASGFKLGNQNTVITRLMNHEMNIKRRDIDLCEFANYDELPNKNNAFSCPLKFQARKLNFKRQQSINDNAYQHLKTRARKIIQKFKCNNSHRTILDSMKPSLIKMFEAKIESEENQQVVPLSILETNKRFIFKRCKTKALFNASAKGTFKMRKARVFHEENESSTKVVKNLDEIMNTNTLKMKVKFVVNSSLVQRLFFYIYERNLEAFRIEFEANSVNPDDVNSLTNRSLLIDAIICENVDIIKYLIYKGASVNLPDIDGNFPIHHAAQIRNYSIIDLLIRKNASQTEVNSNNQNVWEILSKQ